MTGRLSWWRRMVRSRDMASCLEVGTVLQAYLDGEVDEVTAHRVARHLEACRRCGLEAATYTEIKEALARQADAVPQDAVARLRRFGEHLIDHPDAADEPDTGGGVPG